MYGHNQRHESSRNSLCCSLHGKGLSVRLKTEPENPIDANAICFEYQIDSAIGYVVQDTLMDVQDAITKGEIISFCDDCMGEILTTLETEWARVLRRVLCKYGCINNEIWDRVL